MAEPVYQGSGGAVVIGLHELERLRKRFAHLEHAMGDTTALADAMGDQQANSAKRRIRETKRAPDGKRWKPWSRTYAKTRGAQHSLLVDTGALADSITHQVVSPGEVMVGSNLVYAGVHLFGSKKMPQRAFLDTEPGFADSADRRELREVIRAFWEEELGR